MDFSAAIRFPFRGQRWLPNLALLMVCMLIPVIGPIVAMGYGVMMQRMLLRDWTIEPPAFEFGKFVEHLKRGLPPFVASLIFIPVVFAGVVVSWVVILLAILVGQEHLLAGVLIGIFGILLDMILLVAMGVLIVPVVLKSGLEGNIGAGFDWSFLRDFYRRVGWLTLGVQLAIFVMALPLMVFACLPVIGPAVMQTLILMMQWHLHAQLYREYVNRGGRTLVIPIEPEPPAVSYGFPTAPAAPPATPTPPPPPPPIPDEPLFPSH